MRLQRLADDIGYSRLVKVAESRLVRIPIVIGYFKPFILFPIGAINQMSVEEVEAVLAHEIAHLKRNDFLQNLAQSIIETIFYYHPAVWWISAVVRAERESCCDEIAVRMCNSHLSYARALVKLQEVGSAPALALPFNSAKKRHLLNRVQRILNQPQNKSQTMEKIAATGMLLFFLLLSSFRVQQPVDDKVIPENRDQITTTIASDTIIPRRFVRVHENADGREIELISVNGDISSFKVDGEEIPESEYAAYQETIDRMMEDVRNVPEPPLPPAAPLAPEPTMPGEPEATPEPPSPISPEFPEAAPEAPEPPAPTLYFAPGVVPVPDAPAPPPPPAMLFVPDSAGKVMFFDYNAPEIEIEYATDVEFAPEAYFEIATHNSDVHVNKERTESVIVRERDENGTYSYHIESETPGETSIEIDESKGIAIVDGQEVVLDADSVFVIEETETTTNRVRFGSGSAPEVITRYNYKYDLGDYEWNAEDFNAQWRGSWDSVQEYLDSQSEAREKYLKEHAEELNELRFQWDDNSPEAQEYLKHLQERKARIEKQYQESRSKGDARDDNVFIYEIQTTDGQPVRVERIGSVDGVDQEIIVVADSVVHVTRGVAADAERGRRVARARVRSAGNVQGVGVGNSDWLQKQLSADGLIKDGEPYSIVLTGGGLVVNGEEVSDDVFEKYMKLYKENTNETLTGKTTIEISQED